MLIVQKYGGTSVGDLDKIQNVADKVSKTKNANNSVVVVVSAMSGETNKLISYAHHFSKNPQKREFDLLVSSGERVTASLLAIALGQMGHKTVALTGRQAGIYTDDVHTSARINKIDRTKIESHLSENKIVIVAGFQGITSSGDISTLGRGGSDLTAVAIAGAIEANLCEIYTDVDGIYTTDPRIEPKARKIEKISYEEMLELASLGAKVLQNRSVELAKKLNINLVTRNSFNNNEGTLITKEDNIMEKPLVSGIALDKDQARVTLRGVKDEPGIAAKIFTTLSDKNINVDMIIQNIGHDGTTNLGFTVVQKDISKTKKIIKKLHPSEVMEFDDKIVKVSVVGVGMKSHSGVASQAFSALSNKKINIQMISTSEIKISMVISQKWGEKAVKALHKAYKLDK